MKIAIYCIEKSHPAKSPITIRRSFYGYAHVDYPQIFETIDDLWYGFQYDSPKQRYHILHTRPAILKGEAGSDVHVLGLVVDIGSDDIKQLIDEWCRDRQTYSYPAWAKKHEVWT